MTQASPCNHYHEDDDSIDRPSSYFASFGSCFGDCTMDAFIPSMLDWKKGPNEDEAAIPVTRYEGRKRYWQVLNNIGTDSNRPLQRRINLDLFRDPLARKMVEDAIIRSKYNMRSQQLALRSSHNIDNFDEKDEVLDRRIAIAATKKGRQRQTKLGQNELLSYSRRQYRQNQQQSSTQRANKSPASTSDRKSKPRRSQTPLPMPRLSRFTAKSSKRVNEILPKRRNESSSSASILRRRGSKDSKRQTPPTTYCPPLSTPLAPIGEGKTMKDRKKRFQWKRKVTPFQPD